MMKHKLYNVRQNRNQTSRNKSQMTNATEFANRIKSYN